MAGRRENHKPDRGGPKAGGASKESAARRAGGADSVLARWMQREHADWMEPGVWSAWRERCALALCEPSVQAVLKEFIRFQFLRLVGRYADRTNAPGEARELSMNETWHLFESYLAVRQTRGGKRYKDWLFARTGMEPAAAGRILAAGAALLTRDVVREFLRKEFSPVGVASINQPLKEGSARSLSLEELLPSEADPADETAARELEQAARRHAGEWFAAMGRSERVVLLARLQGLPLSHPTVEQAAGCRKSKACLLLRSLVEKVAANIKRDYPEDENDVLHALTVLTLRGIHEHASAWAGRDAVARELIRRGERP